MTRMEICGVAWCVTAARIELARGRTDKARQVLEKLEELLRPHVDQQSADAIAVADANTPAIGLCVDLRRHSTELRGR